MREQIFTWDSDKSDFPDELLTSVVAAERPLLIAPVRLASADELFWLSNDRTLAVGDDRSVEAEFAGDRSWERRDDQEFDAHRSINSHWETNEEQSLCYPKVRCDSSKRTTACRWSSIPRRRCFWSVIRRWRSPRYSISHRIHRWSVSVE